MPKPEIFFIVSPPELVDELEKELEEVWPFLSDQTGRPCLKPLTKSKKLGGIEIQADPVLGFQLNRVLKLASRILWRKASFKAREIYQLEGQLKSLPWANWVSVGAKIRFTVAASESKTNNEKKIHGMLMRLLGKKYVFVDKDEDFHFYLRHHQNEMVISLDTSGEHLHKRGVSFHKTEAPLRETLAASALRFLLEDVPCSEFSSISWLDPMAGSGTHGAELLDYNSLNVREKYSFLNFKETPKILKSQLFWDHHSLAIENNFKNIVLADQNVKAVEILRKNFQRDLRGNTIILQKDLFLADSRSDYSLSSDEKLFMVINPPYGERLKLDDPRGDLNQILDHCWNQLKPQRIGMWTPAAVGDLHLQARLRLRKNLKNGGLPVRFSVWDREE